MRRKVRAIQHQQDNNFIAPRMDQNLRNQSHTGFMERRPPNSYLLRLQARRVPNDIGMGDRIEVQSFEEGGMKYVRGNNGRKNVHQVHEY